MPANGQLRHAISAMVLLSSILVSTPSEAKRAALTGLTASADSASVAFWNPAAMTEVEHSLQLEATVAFLNSDFRVEEASYAGGDPDSQNDVLFIPGNYYVRPLNDQWTAGLSVSVPSGIGTEFGKYWSGRYHSKETSLVFLSLNPSVAYQWSENLSLAGGFQLMYSDSTNKVQVNNGPWMDDGMIKLEEDGFGVGYTLSAFYKVSDDTQVGLQYRSAVDIDMSGNLQFKQLNDLLILELNKTGLLGDEIDVDFTVPQTVFAGVYHQINDKLSVTTDVMWLNMAKFGVDEVSTDELVIRPGSEFDNVFAASAGFEYQLAGNDAVNVGVFYLESAAKTENRSLYLPLDRVWLLGVGYSARQQSGNSFSVNLEFADLGDANIDLEHSLLTGDLVGKFDNHYAVFLNASYTFEL